MKQLIPHFYPNFACIASRCSDSCCIGWEIDIDERTAERYKSTSTPTPPTTTAAASPTATRFPRSFLKKFAGNPLPISC